MLPLLYTLFAVGILYLSSAITIAFLNRNSHAPMSEGPIKFSFRKRAREAYAPEKPKGRLYQIARIVLYLSGLAFWLVIVLFLTRVFKGYL